MSLSHVYMESVPHFDEQPYRIEDGVIEDPYPPITHNNRRRAIEEAFPQTQQERIVEEAKWAARSSPCTSTQSKGSTA